MSAINPLTALAVVLATAATDAVYVMFTSAVVARRRVPAATWSSIWYLLSSFAVISYTNNWIYVCFAALGSWIGAYVSMNLSASRVQIAPAPARTGAEVMARFRADLARTCIDTHEAEMVRHGRLSWRTPMALTASICNFGWKARDFELKGVDGRSYSLADVRGEK